MICPKTNERCSPRTHGCSPFQCLRPFVDNPTPPAAPTLEQLADKCLEEMNGLIACRDKEMAHCRADDILCKLLRAHGHDKLVDVFESLDKWYA